MVKHSFAGLLLVLVVTSAHAAGPGRLQPVPFQEVQVADSFWSPRLKVNRTVTIEANLHQCELTGRINNFAVAAKQKPGKYQGQLYNDADVYKVLEGIAYALSERRDPDLERRTDAIIDLIVAAQQPDGYLNTFITLVRPQDRWKHEQHNHELYCAGHLFEAAVAYYQATGKRKLLDASCKFADYLHSVFGPGKVQETSGHEEIELALVKLYDATQQKRYLDLAKFFVDVRGRKDKRRLFGEYAQDHKPVREQSEVTGHAVRATYLYCGMADVAALTGDQGLLTALQRIWHDIVDRKMYLTGGIGSSASNEGFTVPYDLPNERAYAETCAAIGMALWNHRMFLLSGEGKYADVLEREVYNGLISGVSLSGDRFFYVNPLASAGNHHRVPWFDTSCCPTNVVRYLPGIGERVYAHRDNSLWTVLYLGNTATVTLKDGKVKLKQETKYPWEGDLRITVDPEKSFAFTLNLRIPGWCRSQPTITINGEELKGAKPVNGYVSVARTWKAGDVVRLTLPMPVKRVYADPHVKADVGRVALQRGPIVYCLEGVDNGGSVRNLVLPKDARLTAAFDKNLLGGVVVVRGDALRVSLNDDNKRTIKPVPFLAVPYSTWDNRKPGPMVLWLPEQPEGADLPAEQGVLLKGVRICASHVNPSDTLRTLNDGGTPKSSNDHSIPRMTWWDHRGSAEWLSYRFPAARQISSSAVYWFDDTATGQCRVPAEWRLLWRDGDEWKPIKLLENSRYGTARNAFNPISFEPVTTRELKLEVKLRAGFSGGVLKWAVAHTTRVPIQLKTRTGNLDGTLDLPDGPGPHPLVIVIAGSGPTDRDGNQPGLKLDYLKQLGAGLAQRGIAVLRYDRRGIGKSAAAWPGREEDFRFEMLADDASAWVHMLRRDHRFGRIGLLGHSLGSLIGLVAAQKADIDAFVSLAGPGRKTHEVLREQFTRNLAPDLAREGVKILDELAAGRTVADPPKGLILRKSVQPYLISEFQYDPAAAIARLAIPALIVHGTRDERVSSADAERLAQANSCAELCVINGMNHILRSASNPVEQWFAWNAASAPLAPELTDRLAAFLQRTLK
jgi:DUF1680 family protein/pimeloyl-ACP methyl ester carboxylesterase